MSEKSAAVILPKMVEIHKKNKIAELPLRSSRCIAGLSISRCRAPHRSPAQATAPAPAGMRCRPGAGSLLSFNGGVPIPPHLLELTDHILLVVESLIFW